MRLAVLVVMMLCLPATADPPKPVPKPVVKERLEVTVKVAEIPKPIYYCGVIAFRTVVRFEVISVDKGTWADKDVYAVQLCPEVLKVGQKLHLVLEKPTGDQGYVDKFPAGPRWVIRGAKSL